VLNHVAGQRTPESDQSTVRMTMKTNNRAELMKASLPPNMMLQVHNKRVLNSFTLEEYLNLIQMQKQLIDVRATKPATAAEA